jgi:hypothetical protein
MSETKNKMRPFHSVIIFMIFVVCAALSSMHSYNVTKDSIIQDMNQALCQTISQKATGYITPDTIINYRQHLKIDALRNRSFLYYACNNKGNVICSRKIKWNSQRYSVEFQSYANCSTADIMGLSDQRLPTSILIIGILWAILSIWYFRKQYNGFIVLGNMMYAEDEHSFYDLNKAPVALTPMQEKLMTMFFSSSNHKLSKQQICDELWPKKPDASETLYTLVRRIKPIIQTRGNLKIISERGRDYKLSVNN